MKKKINFDYINIIFTYINIVIILIFCYVFINKY